MIESTEQALSTGQEIIRLAQVLESSINTKWNDDVMQQIDTQGTEIIALADAVKITNGETFIKANELVLRIKQYSKENLSFCEPFKKAAKAPGKLMDDIIKKIKNNHDKSLSIASTKVLTWKREQDRIRAEEQRKLDEQRERREAAERERLLKQAEKAEAKGQVEKADDLVERATEVYVPPVIAESRVEKTTVTNVGRVTVIPDPEVELVSKIDLIKAVFDGIDKLSIDIIKIDIKAVKDWAKSNEIKNYNANGLRISPKGRLSGLWSKS